MQLGLRCFAGFLGVYPQNRGGFLGMYPGIRTLLYGNRHVNIRTTKRSYIKSAVRSHK